MSENTFKTIDEQLDILKSRSLNVYDDNKAKLFLLQNNYYRISGYSLTLRDHDTFFENACFQNIIDIYRFDHEFRHILMKYIEMIEVKMKSIYAYHYSRLYGPSSYLDKSNFTDEIQYQRTMDKINVQKEKRLPHEPYLKHFVNDLKIDIPIWAVVDLMTIADVSQLYAISLTELQEAVAVDFGFKMKDKIELLCHMMKGITIIRNLCAHGSRLFNRLFEQRPWLNKKEKELLIRVPVKTAVEDIKTEENNTTLNATSGQVEIDNSHLYGFILYMKRLLPMPDFSAMKSEIHNLCELIPFVDMRHYGFREDWENVL